MSTRPRPASFHGTSDSSMLRSTTTRFTGLPRQLDVNAPHTVPQGLQATGPATPIRSPTQLHLIRHLTSVRGRLCEISVRLTVSFIRPTPERNQPPETGWLTCGFLERTTRFELATLTLARKRDPSTQHVLVHRARPRPRPRPPSPQSPPPSGRLGKHLMPNGRSRRARETLDPGARLRHELDHPGAVPVLSNTRVASSSSAGDTVSAGSSKATRANSSASSKRPTSR